MPTLILSASYNTESKILRKAAQALSWESFRFQDETNTATQLPLAWEAGLGFNFYKVPRFRLDAEARFVQAKGADVSFWMLGITGRGDVATF